MSGRRALLALVAVASALGPAGCRSPSAADAGAPLARVAAVDAGRAADDDLPSRGAYAGSSACRDCHLRHFEGWARDWHPRALSDPSPATVVGRFDGTHFKGRSTEATMFRRDGGWFMRTADKDAGVRDWPVSSVVGGKRMQDALTALPDGRWQVLPVYFHVTGRGEWVDYNESKQGAVGPDHPFYWSNFRRTANRECIACHATGWSVSYRRATGEWSTSLEPGVGCEACHGPGARHAETKAPEDIVALGKLPPDRAVAVCASCHGPREPHFPTVDRAHQFKPGAAYDDFFVPSGLVDGENRSGEYFVDGRPSSSSFEWQALQQSRCFTRGGVTCLTCHTGPHGDPLPNELKRADGGTVDDQVEAPCRTCHPAEAGDRAGHSHHADPKGQRCLGCHLPPTLTGVLDRLADHSIDVPAPEVTVAHGVPNACGVCHPAMPATKLAARTATWWPGSTRRVRRARLADAFDEKTRARSEAPLVFVLQDPDEVGLLKGFAAELLGQRFPDRATAVLPALLDSKDPYLRSRALAGLSAAKAKSTADAVARRLEDPSLLVRQLAAILLTTWQDARGQQALERFAASPASRALPRPHVLLAQRFLAAKQLDRAREEVDVALSLAPYSPAALVLRADVLVEVGDLDAARAALEEALRFDPSNEGAKARLKAFAAAP